MNIYLPPSIFISLKVFQVEKKKKKKMENFSLIFVLLNVCHSLKYLSQTDLLYFQLVNINSEIKRTIGIFANSDFNCCSPIESEIHP